MRINILSLFLVNFLIVCSIYSTNTTVQSDIFYEISQGNLKAVKKWASSKPDVSVCNDQGQSVLTAAVLTNNHNLIKAVLKSAVDINTIDQQGKTALDWACDYGNEKIVMLLVQAGAKVTTRANEDWAKKIVSSYQDYWLYYFGLKLIPLTFLVIVATFLGVAICGWLGLKVFYEACWSTYLILSACCAVPMLLFGWPIWLAAPTAWFWVILEIETQGMISCGVAAVVPIALFITLIGYGTGYAISQIRSSSRSYFVDKSQLRSLVV